MIDLNSKTAEHSAFVDRFDTFLFDLDGVIWIGNRLIKHADLILKNLKDKGKRILFVTNNSTKSRNSYVEKFKTLGIAVDSPDCIFGSSYCAAYYIASLGIPKGKKVFVLGMEGVCEELQAFGIEWCGGPLNSPNLANMSELDPEKLDLEDGVVAVLIGFDLNINYKKIAKAFCHLQNPETLFLATNDDLTYPANGSTFPGTGLFIHGLAASSGRTPKVLGKPHQTMLDCIVNKWNLDRSKTLMIGDRLDTDIAFGKMGNVNTLLVLSGVTDRSALDSSKIKPDYIIESIGDLSLPTS